jgi:hypothetical protein
MPEQVSKGAHRHVRRYLRRFRFEYRRELEAGRESRGETPAERRYIREKTEAFTAILRVLEREFGDHGKPSGG